MKVSNSSLKQLIFLSIHTHHSLYPCFVKTSISMYTYRILVSMVKVSMVKDENQHTMGLPSHNTQYTCIQYVHVHAQLHSRVASANNCLYQWLPTCTHYGTAPAIDGDNHDQRSGDHYGKQEESSENPSNDDILLIVIDNHRGVDDCPTSAGTGRADVNRLLVHHYGQIAIQSFRHYHVAKLGWTRGIKIIASVNIIKPEIRTSAY